jgi:hypothetical protein
METSFKTSSWKTDEEMEDNIKMNLEEIAYVDEEWI